MYYMQLTSENIGIKWNTKLTELDLTLFIHKVQFWDLMDRMLHISDKFVYLMYLCASIYAASALILTSFGSPRCQGMQ